MIPNTVDHAINTLQCVKHLGYQGQMTWALTSIGIPPTKDNLEDGDVKAGAEICFEVARYLQFWLHDEVYEVYPAYSPLSFNRLPIETWTYTNTSTMDPTFWTTHQDGVYYVDLDVMEESYFCVVVLKGNQLTYAGGYGGRGEFVLETFDRTEWQDLFNQAMYSDLDSYTKVFCLDYPEIKDCRLEKLTIKRSPTYN